MGQSTNAILFFGYCWNEEYAIDDDLRRTAGVEDYQDTPEWTKIIAAARDIVNPWDDYPENPADSYVEKEARGNAWVDANRQRIDDYRAAIASIEGEYGGVSLTSHCSGECPMPMLVAWSMTAYRGGPQHVEQLPKVQQAWTDNLSKWLTDLRVAAPQDAPRFWLVSDWI